MSKERIEELKKIVEHPSSENDLMAVITEVFNNPDMSDEEICEVFNNMHFPNELSDELKEFLQNDEETALKK